MSATDDMLNILPVVITAKFVGDFTKQMLPSGNDPRRKTYRKKTNLRKKSRGNFSNLGF
jgi:hypothetical protein